MQPTICSSVTAENAHMFREQMERIAGFATRVHIDLSDGIFSPTKLIDIDKVWWPGGVRADLHVMLQRPFEHVELYRALGPQMVIVHAEAEGDFEGFASILRGHGIETGVALLQETPVEKIAASISLINHVLIFSGTLGSFGGTADLKLLEKVRALRALKPTLEIGWDGGINDQNAKTLTAGGVDVLNVGGFIQRSEDPEASYQALSATVRV